MKSQALEHMTNTVRRTAMAAIRDEQVQLANGCGFKASLVEDPLGNRPSLTGAFERARTRGRPE